MSISKEDIRIMLAEDDPTLQIVFRMQLKRLGYEVAAIVDNGLDAAEKARKESFDLIFMDVRMPILDGISATRQIRSQEPAPDSRPIIIGLTAFAHKATCIEAGMDDFLQKPVFLEGMHAVLERWLRDSCPMPMKVVQAQFIEEPLQTITESKERLKEIEEKIYRLRKSVGLE